jgi:hypothetical protein
MGDIVVDFVTPYPDQCVNPKRNYMMTCLCIVNTQGSPYIALVNLVL